MESASSNTIIIIIIIQTSFTTIMKLLNLSKPHLKYEKNAYNYLIRIV